MLELLVGAVMRAPRLAIAVLLLVLAALAGSLSYAGYLVVGVVATYLDIGRFTTGLLLAILFARLPAVREGRLTSIGLLPKPARLPTVLALLALACVAFIRHNEWVPVLFLAFAACFAIAYRHVRQKFIGRTRAFIFGSADSAGRAGRDDGIIDAEFTEKKDQGPEQLR